MSIRSWLGGRVRASSSRRSATSLHATRTPSPVLAAFALPLLLALGVACAAPGQPVSPQPGDFAFLEIDLRG